MDSKAASLAKELVALQDPLWRLALKLTGNRDDAQDLTQDTLLKALQHAAGFRGDASLKTWATRILVNTYLTQERKKPPHKSLALEYIPVPDWSANPERVVVKRELQWCIHHTLIHHLPERYAAALTLREYEGLSYREISHILNVTAGTAKVLVHRSRRAFKRHLEASGCYSYVQDYSCICDGVTAGLLPIKQLNDNSSSEFTGSCADGS